MVVVENMDMKDVQKLEEKFENVSHVKDVLWYDDVADISLPVEMIPDDLREAFFKGDATMMLVLFDNTTSSDESMDAVSEMRKIANEQCFISGMTGVVADIKNLALKELPIYVVIAALLSLIVLELTSGSFVVPILFLLSIGLAILCCRKFCDDGCRIYCPVCNDFRTWTGSRNRYGERCTDRSGLLCNSSSVTGTGF